MWTFPDLFDRHGRLPDSIKTNPYGLRGGYTLTHKERKIFCDKERKKCMKKAVGPYLESRFVYKGFPCVVLFQPLCHRCGYVGLPKGHPLYNVDYAEIDIDCHGGLTYASDELSGVDIPDTWWIGFDCAHAGDRQDLETGKLYFKDDPERLKTIEILERTEEKFDKRYPNAPKESIRTKEYVENECKKIVDQLVAK